MPRPAPEPASTRTVGGESEAECGRRRGAGGGDATQLASWAAQQRRPPRLHTAQTLRTTLRAPRKCLMARRRHCAAAVGIIDTTKAHGSDDILSVQVSPDGKFALALGQRGRASLLSMASLSKPDPQLQPIHFSATMGFRPSTIDPTTKKIRAARTK